ncbi:MAG: beta-galactosidase [Fimbriimonadaceae bacterium]|nr:beta-galactosidase [Fimbriimonadaceae bacterium]
MPTPFLLLPLLLTADDDLLLTTTGPAAAAGWSFSPGGEFPGATGALRVEPSGEAVLSFDFRNGGAYVAAYRTLDPPAPLTALRLELRQPEGATITFRATDSSGQTHQRSVRYDETGWTPLAGSLLQGWTGHWGGPDDGVVRPPFQQLGVLVEQTGLSQPVGEVRFRQVVATRGEAGPVEQNLVGSYLVTDFGPDAGFGASGGELVKQRFSADLSARPNALLHHSLSLFGAPRELQLSVADGTPGARLSLQLGSHFQTFGRGLGTLRGGPQTFTVPVPPEGWEFWGGENNGRVQPPLRLAVLLLERGEAPAGPAFVHLDSLRCVTSTARSRAVTLLSRLSEAAVNGGQRTLRGTVRGWNLQPTAVEGTLRGVLRDWDGRELERRELPWQLPAAGVPQEQTVEFSVPADLRFADLEASYTVGELPPVTSRAGFTRPVEAPAETAPRPASPWGMGLYLYRYPGDAAGLARMDRAAALGAAAGVKWSREELQWHRLEPERGKFDWTYYDQMLATAQRHGISVYGLLAYWSRWTKAYTPEGVTDYVAWVRQVVRRYKDRVKHWEIWNEPNIFFWSGPKELYPVMLQQAYRAIKEEDPTAQVLGCSTAGIDRGFIQRCLDAQAPFDILTIHPYRGQLDDKAFAKELRDVQALVGGRPVWITEMGWPTQLNGGVDERTQAQLLARCYLTAVASGACTNISWYDFRNDGGDPFYNEHNFGVVRGDLTPKPAYRALATVCRTLALAPRPVAGLPDRVWGVTAAGGTAFWAATRQRLTLRVTGGQPRAVNLMGDALPGALSPLDLAPGLPLLVVDGQVEVTAVEPLDAPDQSGVVRF